MSSKLIKSKHGHDVTVEHTVGMQTNFLHTIDIVAFVGPVIKEQKRLTIGAVDGIRLAPPTKEQLQKELDDHRQSTADEASWKEHVRVNIAGIE